MTHAEAARDAGRTRPGSAAGLVAMLLAMLLPLGAAWAQGSATPAATGGLPMPKLVWERATDIGAPPERSDERPDPFGHVLALAARPDGGALIVATHPAGDARGTLRVLATDGTGKTVFDTIVAKPPTARPGDAVTVSVAVSAEAADRTWLLQTWQDPPNPEVDEPALSRLIGLDGTGRLVSTTRLPAKIAGARDIAIDRRIRVLRRMADGSLLAGGTAWHAPPIWWFARFTVGGKLLHEQASRRFPDYIEDARGNADGGYSLLMIDAEHGPETVTIRRHGADGRLAARHTMPALAQALGCAVLVGPTRQLRILAEYGTGERSRSDAVWHEPGRGAISRLDLGPLGCDRLERAGTTVLMTASALPVMDDAPAAFLAFNDSGLRWRLPPAEAAIGTPVADGGALLLRYTRDGGNAVLRLSRYAAP